MSANACMAPAAANLGAAVTSRRQGSALLKRATPQARCDHRSRPLFSPIPSVSSRASLAMGRLASRPSPSLPRKALSVALPIAG